MPASRHKSSTKPLPTSMYRLRDKLANEGISNPNYAVAVAGLGCLGMLEEREAAERAVLPQALAKSSPWALTWREVYSAGGKEGLLAWLHAQREQIDSCPFSTAKLRGQVLDSFSTWDQHSPLELASSHLQEACDAESTATFTSAFRHYWTELSLLMEIDRKAENYELREEFRWVLQQLTHIQPREKALLIQTTGMVFLIELMDRLKKKGLENVLCVDCHNTPEDLFALATLLSHGVKVPRVRFIEIDQAPDVGAYDWIIAIPPFGIRVNTPDWCPVQGGTERGESFVIQRAAMQLAEGGRCLALMQRTFTSTRHSRVREWLVMNYRVDGVLELPGHAAYSGIGTTTSLMCFRRGRPSDEVFILGENIFSSRLLKPRISIQRNPLQEVILAPVLRQFGLDVDTTRLERELLSPMQKEVYDPSSKREAQAILAWINNGQPLSLDGTGMVPLCDGKAALIGPFHDDLEEAIRLSEAHDLPVTFVPLKKAALEIVAGNQVPVERTWQMARTSLEECVAKGLHAERPVITAGDLRDLSNGLIPTRYVNQDLGREPEARWGDILVAKGSNGDLLVARYEQMNEAVRHLATLDDGAYVDDSVVVIRVLYGAITDLTCAFLKHPTVQARLLRLTSAKRPSGKALAQLLASLPILSSDEVFDQLYLTKRLASSSTLCQAVLDLATAKTTERNPVLKFANLGTSLRQKKLTDSSGKLKADALDSMVSLISDHLRDDSEDTEYYAPIVRVVRAWWEELQAALEELSSIIKNYKKAPQLAALQHWQLQMADFSTFGGWLSNGGWIKFDGDDELNQVSRTVPSEVQSAAFGLLEDVREAVSAWCQSIIETVSIESSVSPQRIRDGSAETLSLVLVNKSPLPLREMKVEVMNAKAGPFILATEGEICVPFEFAQGSVGLYGVPFNWTAIRLDGCATTGSGEVTVNVITADESAFADIGSNPYVDARTLQGTEDRVFFGREKEIARIRAELAKPSAATVLLIEGNRRTGKTSLLHHFVRHHLPEEWIAADCSFQSGEGEGATAERGARRGIPTREVFYILAKSIVYAVVRAGVRLDLEGLGVLEPEWRPAKILRQTTELLHPCFQDGPAYSRLCGILDQCLEAMGDRRLLLSIDEFDRLQEGIDSGVTSDQVPENIRHLFQTYNQVAGILTGSRKIRRLREQYWNVLFGIGDPLILRGLEPQAVRDLIIKPVEGRLTYVPAAVDRIAHLTAGQPRIIQTLCSRLFAECADSGKRLITESMVDAVAAEKARDYEHFKVLWSAVESATHQYVGLVINRMVGRGDTTITFDLIRDEAGSEGVDLSEKALEAALADLMDLEVASERMERSVKHYGIEIPLMSDWLDQNEDIDKIRLAAQQLLNL